MGIIHFYGARKLKGGKVTAMATRDPRRPAGDWSMIQGNFGPTPKSNEDISGMPTYSSYEELPANPSVDRVDICLPTDQHGLVTLAALEATKHVWVEKPISLNTDEADRMTRAAHHAGKHLMVAQALPLVPECQFAREVSLIRKTDRGSLQAYYFPAQLVGRYCQFEEDRRSRDRSAHSRLPFRGTAVRRT